ncbi:MAG: hypothetical protein VW378_03935 [bacterium]
MNKQSIPKVFIYSFISLILTIQPLLSTTNFNGATGLIFIPTAEALNYKECNYGLDYSLAKDKDNLNYKYKVNMGIYENIELGFSGGKYPSEGVYVNTKYYLMSTEERFPLKIAIGVENLTAKDHTSVYTVFSKRLNPETSGHFGFNAKFDDEITPGILAGLTFYLTEIVEILADISGEGQTYTANVGARLYYSDYGTFQIALSNIFNLTEPSLILGITQRNFL